jgi:hypothetical protein
VSASFGDLAYACWETNEQRRELHARWDGSAVSPDIERDGVADAYGAPREERSRDAQAHRWHLLVDLVV